MIVNEIFYSIQGESTRAGLPCTFVRLTGCDLRCVYCDTTYAFRAGRAMGLEQVVAEVERIGCRFVTVTGGEPLLQDESFVLIEHLGKMGYDVQVETSGSVDISRLEGRARVILDIKTPGSGMLDRMDWDNLQRLRKGDEVKFVLMGRPDYEWSRRILRESALPSDVAVLLSPAHDVLDPRDLAQWMKEDRIAARLHLQLHKYVWGADKRGV